MLSTRAISTRGNPGRGGGADHSVALCAQLVQLVFELLGLGRYRFAYRSNVAIALAGRGLGGRPRTIVDGSMKRAADVFRAPVAAKGFRKTPADVRGREGGARLQPAPSTGDETWCRSKRRTELGAVALPLRLLTLS